jgi:hypothetical protein
MSLFKSTKRGGGIMTDSEYIEKLEAFFDEMLPQIGKLVSQDYGRLNDIAMEQSRRKREMTEGDEA